LIPNIYSNTFNFLINIFSIIFNIITTPIINIYYFLNLQIFYAGKIITDLIISINTFSSSFLEIFCYLTLSAIAVNLVLLSIVLRNHLDIVNELENEFEKSINDDENSKKLTYRDIINKILLTNIFILFLGFSKHIVVYIFNFLIEIIKNYYITNLIFSIFNYVLHILIFVSLAYGIFEAINIFKRFFEDELEELKMKVISIYNYIKNSINVYIILLFVGYIYYNYSILSNLFKKKDLSFTIIFDFIMNSVSSFLGIILRFNCVLLVIGYVNEYFSYYKNMEEYFNFLDFKNFNKELFKKKIKYISNYKKSKQYNIVENIFRARDYLNDFIFLCLVLLNINSIYLFLRYIDSLLLYDVYLLFFNITKDSFINNILFFVFEKIIIITYLLFFIRNIYFYYILDNNFNFFSNPKRKPEDKKKSYSELYFNYIVNTEYAKMLYVNYYFVNESFKNKLEDTKKNILNTYEHVIQIYKC
jgi:hypothetical protein